LILDFDTGEGKGPDGSVDSKKYKNLARYVEKLQIDLMTDGLENMGMGQRKM
jgi:hypothetical protein